MRANANNQTPADRRFSATTPIRNNANLNGNGARRFSVPEALNKSFTIFETRSVERSGLVASPNENETIVTPMPLYDDVEDEKVDLGGFTTDQEFKALRSSDPFLFYSIPEVRRRSLTFSDEFDFSGDEDDSSDDDENVLAFASRFHQPGQSQARNQANSEAKSSAHEARVAIPSRDTASDTNTNDQAQDSHATVQHKAGRRRSSLIRANTCPAGMLANAEIRRSLIESGSTVVCRRHRLATEAHPSLVVDDFMSSMGSESFRDMSIGEDDSSLDFSDDEDVCKVEPLRRVLKSMSSRNVLGHGEK